MNQHIVGWNWCVIIFAFVLGSSDLQRADVAAAEEVCSVPSEWLPITPLPTVDTPPPHPGSDCPFYKSAWNFFLYAAQPDSDGRPRFLSTYSTIGDLFGANIVPQFPEQTDGLLSLAPQILQFPNEKPMHLTNVPAGIDSGVNQAGPLRGLLIDQNGNPIYYAIHVNDVFATFIRQNGLTQKDALLNADPDLQFGEGAVELKSAWQIVDGTTPQKDYFTTQALVPNLRIENGDVIADSSSRTVTVALIAIHVVFVLKGHPEFIWSTFEHVSADGQGLRDNAPSAANNPGDTPDTTVISNTNWLLFKAGTKASEANIPPSLQDRVNSFDPGTQKFNRNGAILQSSIYRMFPASSSSGIEEDGDVVAVNNSVRDLYNSIATDPTDKRKNYQLVGAIWLDNPARDFKSNMLFENQADQSTDDIGAMVAGEDRLSSTAMESFTQSELGQPNCFSCHNTKRVTDDITHKTIIPPKRLNVSHVLSKFLSESE